MISVLSARVGSIEDNRLGLVFIPSFKSCVEYVG